MHFFQLCIVRFEYLINFFRFETTDPKVQRMMVLLNRFSLLDPWLLWSPCWYLWSPCWYLYVLSKCFCYFDSDNADCRRLFRGKFPLEYILSWWGLICYLVPLQDHYDHYDDDDDDAIKSVSTITIFMLSTKVPGLNTRNRIITELRSMFR